MSLQEKSVTCFDCGVSFIYSVEEQEAFQSKGYANVPKRCASCRQERKTRQLNSSNNRGIQPGFHMERKMYPAVCARCGKSTQVPFEPREGRPVFCRDCYYTSKVPK